MGDALLLVAGTPRTLGVSSKPRLRFGESPKPEGAWAGSRQLWIDEEPAFRLSFWCGTCPYFFERLESSDETLSLADLEDRLSEGVDGLDEDVIAPFASLLALGQYIPLLLRVQPELIHPEAPGDYFAEERAATWGVDAWWGRSEQQPYYRTFETPVDEPLPPWWRQVRRRRSGHRSDAHLFEFIVPLVPPSWNDRARVARYAKRLSTTSRPTAVAVSILDVCQPVTDGKSRDYFAHWAVTHFLLDGHHKIEAASDTHMPLQLLSLLFIDASLASPDQVARVPQLRGRPQSKRPTTL